MSGVPFTRCNCLPSPPSALSAAVLEAPHQDAFWLVQPWKFESPCKGTADSGGWNCRSLLSHSPRGWKSKVKLWAGWVRSEASLLGVQKACLCPNHLFF